MNSSIQMNKASNFICQGRWFDTNNISGKLFIVLVEKFLNATKTVLHYYIVGKVVEAIKF